MPLGHPTTCFTFRPRTQALLRPLGLVLGGAFLFGFALMPCRRAGAETWTNLRGTRTIEADLIGVWGDQVLLKLPNGKRVSVPMEDLRSDSRIKANKLVSQIDQRRADRGRDLQTAANAAAAPAPHPLPKPPAAPKYTRPPTGGTLEAFLESVHQSQVDGHVRVLYDALPGPSRKKVAQATQDIVQNVGTDELSEFCGMIQGLGESLVNKQSWLRSSPRISEDDDDQRAFIDDFVIPLGGLMSEVFSPEVLSIDELAKGNLEPVLAEVDTVAAPYLRQLFRYFEMESPAFFVDEQGDEATLSQGSVSQGSVSQRSGSQGPGSQGLGKTERKQKWVKTNGHWAPEDHAEMLDQAIEEAKRQFAAGGAASNTISVLNLALGLVVPSLQAAQTKDEFHVAVEEIVEPISSLAHWISAFGAPQRGRNSFGGSFGPSDEEMYQQEMMNSSFGPNGNGG